MSPRLSRREFIGRCALGGLGAALGCVWPAAARAASPRDIPDSALKEAAFWKSLPGGVVRCLTCPNECTRDEGEVSLCRTRINRGGRLYTLTFGKPCVVFQDPLEKNPLCHVEPGSQSLGIGTAGCNLACKYCQNWSFSQAGPWETRNLDLPPDGIVKRAKDRNLDWITFSYTEPVAYLEYALETAKLAKSAGLKVAMVTAAYIHPAPLEELIRHVDAFSVTLKGYTDVFYHDVVGGSLEVVWQNIATLVKARRWVEVVTLVVPTMNDDEKGLRSIARALARLSPDVPLHFERFSPAYKLQNLPPTPISTLEKARDMARQEGLRYVYLANVPGHAAASTYCPKCNRRLIERVNFMVLSNELRHGACPSCGHVVPGFNI